MNSFINKIKPHVFFLGFLGIIILSITLRVYNINERSGLGSDSTRDALIAQEALKRGELPLIGSFSSAGPFVFGPLYFWFNMVALFIMPFSFKTPWILMNIVGVSMVIVMTLSGYFIGGKRLALLTGMLAATSPQFISRSTGLTQHSLVGITSALLLLFFILFWKKRSLKYAFLMGLSMGTALSMHYQALNFFIFIPFLFLTPNLKIKKKIYAVLLFVLGVIIPSTPLLYWDAQQQFANIRNILDYMLIGQHRIYVPNSWNIFIFQFLIDYWSNVVGGNKIMSGILMLLVPLTISYAFIKKKTPSIIISISFIFFILLLVLRFYKGERFDGYMIYIAPFIFILCAWTLHMLFDLIKGIKNKKIKKILKYIFLMLILLIIIFNLKNASQFIFTQSDHQKQIRTAEAVLLKTYSNQKFQIYDYYWRSSDASYPLGAFLEQAGKTDPNGVEIGIVFGDFPMCNTPTPLLSNGWWKMYELRFLPEHQITKPEWSPANPSDIYDDLMKWQKTEKLETTFHLNKYLLERLHLR